MKIEKVESLLIGGSDGSPGGHHIVRITGPTTVPTA